MDLRAHVANSSLTGEERDSETPSDGDAWAASEAQSVSPVRALDASDLWDEFQAYRHTTDARRLSPSTDRS